MGRPLTLKSSMPAERLEAVAREVDDQLRELQQAFPTSTLAEVAILAALNLACEIMESKEEMQKLRHEIEERSWQLIRKLEVPEP